MKQHYFDMWIHNIEQIMFSLGLSVKCGLTMGEIDEMVISNMSELFHIKTTPVKIVGQVLAVVMNEFPY